jgi:hypothetical protein
MICEVHIHDNQFFMGVYTIEVPTTDNYFIKEFLLKRYTADKIPFDITSLLIVDDELNSIYLSEENKLEIVYLSHKTQHLIA